MDYYTKARNVSNAVMSIIAGLKSKTRRYLKMSEEEDKSEDKGSEEEPEEEKEKEEEKSSSPTKEVPKLEALPAIVEGDLKKKFGRRFSAIEYGKALLKKIQEFYDIEPKSRS